MTTESLRRKAEVVPASLLWVMIGKGENMSRIKYLAIYSGPSCFSYDDEYMMAFGSIERVKDAFLSFHRGSVSYRSMRKNADELYVEWEEIAHSLTPATSEQDTMEVYYAHEVSSGVRGTYECHGPIFRLSLGPRGGVVKENY